VARKIIIVGVLNVTPDSFSDGGRFATVAEAVAAGVQMVDDGADWIDVGGESTRPGSVAVPEEEERRRVVPVIQALAEVLSGRARVCVDTYRSGTARAALAAGATVVNDVSGGLLDPPIVEMAARAGAALVLGHLRGPPATMFADVRFDDVVREVGDELAERISGARAAGCKEVWADPGIGFGKGTALNLQLLAALPALVRRWAGPVYVGVSRKRFIGDLTGRPAGERAFGTAAAVTASILGGAGAVRVHDVAATKDVVAVAAALADAQGAPVWGLIDR
jgi:dihydropteroate synthase